MPLKKLKSDIQKVYSNLMSEDCITEFDIESIFSKFNTDVEKKSNMLWKCKAIKYGLAEDVIGVKCDSLFSTFNVYPDNTLINKYSECRFNQFKKSKEFLDPEYGDKLMRKIMNFS